MFKRNGVWWMAFRVDGRKVRKSLGTSNRKLAEQIEAKVKLDVAQGKYFEKPVWKEKTFMEMAERYIATVSSRKAPLTYERETGTFKNHLVPFFGKMLIADITPKAIVAFKEMRLRTGIMNDSFNKELGLLKACFNKAIREWEWAETNPVCRVAMEKSAEGRVRYLSDDEFSRLLAACEGWLKPMVIAARFTGIRQGNILSLTWKQVDLFRKVIVLPKSKTTSYGVPICEVLLKVFVELQKVRHLRSDYVFCEPDGAPYYKMKVYRVFKQACGKAGIMDFRWHDLRHDFASQLVQGGVDLLVVQKLMNHADMRMTLRYAHLSPKNLEEAVKVFDRGHNLDTLDAAGKTKSG